MQCIKLKKLDQVIYEYFKNDYLIVGICLGMQVLVDTGVENSTTEGLKLIRAKPINLNLKKTKKISILGGTKLILQTKISVNLIKKNFIMFIHML